MRILKSLLVCTTAAAGVAYVSLAFADDTDAQAKARQAVREAVQQMEAQNAAPIPQAAPAPTPSLPADAIVKARKELRQERTAPIQPLVVPKPSEDEAIANAREATRRKLQEVEDEARLASAQEPPSSSPPTRKPVNRSAQNKTTTPAGVRSAKNSGLETPSASGSKSEPAAPVAPPIPKKPSPQSTEFQPFERAPSPFTGSQQQQLSELLKRYMADEVTPEQYHEERVKILQGK